eukprot:jgi/Picsp_1/3410/NSC_06248-R1_ef-hand and p25-alpha domain containg protein
MPVIENSRMKEKGKFLRFFGAYKSDKLQEEEENAGAKPHNSPPKSPDPQSSDRGGSSPEMDRQPIAEYTPSPTLSLQEIKKSTFETCFAEAKEKMEAPCPLEHPFSISPEVCQLRTLMGDFDSNTREDLENIARRHPNIGLKLVEILQVYASFCHASLIAQCESSNMALLASSLRLCISDMANTFDTYIEPSEFERHCDIVASMISCLTNIALCYSQPGWMYRALLDTELISTLHNILSSIMSSNKNLGESGQNIIDISLKNNNKIITGELKTLGKGSWAQGLADVKNHPTMVKKLSTLLGVAEESILRESMLNLSLPWGVSPVSSGIVRVAESEAVYHEYLISGELGISPSGFDKLFNDMKTLEASGKKSDEIKSRKCFVAVDEDVDGVLNLKEFQQFYLEKRISVARSFVRLVCGLALETQMFKVFRRFASFGAPKSDMDVKIVNNVILFDVYRFIKLCKDSNILKATGLSTEKLNVIFSKCVPMGAKRMSFDNFLLSLPHLSVLTRKSLSVICNKIASCKGPEKCCTKPGFVKLHDDKSTFTGIYARGGPNLGPISVDLKAYVSRSKDNLNIQVGDLEITQPESPILVTKTRLSSPGPLTPGRGASMEACESRRSLQETLDETHGQKNKKSPVCAFGRTIKTSPFSPGTAKQLPYSGASKTRT